MNFAVTAVNSREGEGQIINVVFDWGRVSCFQYGGSLRRELFNHNTDKSVSKYQEMFLHKFGFCIAFDLFSQSTTLKKPLIAAKIKLSAFRGL